MSRKLKKQAKECLKETGLSDFSKEDAFEIGFQSGYLIAVDEIIDLLDEELCVRECGDGYYGETEVFWQDCDSRKNPNIKKKFIKILKKRMGC